MILTSVVLLAGTPATISAATTILGSSTAAYYAGLPLVSGLCSIVVGTLLYIPLYVRGIRDDLSEHRELIQRHRRNSSGNFLNTQRRNNPLDYSSSRLARSRSTEIPGAYNKAAKTDGRSHSGPILFSNASPPAASSGYFEMLSHDDEDDGSNVFDDTEGLHQTELSTQTIGPKTRIPSDFSSGSTCCSSTSSPMRRNVSSSSVADTRLFRQEKQQQQIYSAMITSRDEHKIFLTANTKTGLPHSKSFISLGIPVDERNVNNSA